jgi:glucose-6-phosphate 1-epimerase
MASNGASSGGPPLAGNINVALGKGELPTATLSHPSGASCEVVLTGAHVTSWRTVDGVERLFVSSASGYGPGVAIRGGIPVCFPQFSGRGELPKHGFVRTSDEWEIAEMSSEGGACRLVLRLAATDATRALWPHEFEATYAITLTEGGLSTELAVANTHEAAPLSFTAALHTYFGVSDVSEVGVRGLHGLTYEDNAAGGTTATEAAEEVRLAGEVDRVYLDAPEQVVLRYPTAAEGKLIVSKSPAFRDVVLWNLGEAKAPSMADLGEGEWRRYVCLEAGAIGTPVTLAPGESFVGTQSFSHEA